MTPIDYQQRISVSALTIVGPRDENQDHAIIFAMNEGDTHTYVVDGDYDSLDFEYCGRDLSILVADGMGGLEKGRDASRRTLGIILDAISNNVGESKGDLSHYMYNIINDASEKLKISIPGSGSTILIATIVGGNLNVFHVGDSRCYIRLKNGEVIRTIDHSPVDSLLASGIISEDEVNDHPMRNVISNFIGGNVKVGHMGAFDDWEHIMLCSDGVHSCLKPKELNEMMIMSANADSVIKRCSSEGIEDNATCITVTRINMK